VRCDLELRPATAEDAEDLLLWRNDEVTRRMSRNTGMVAREDHLKWYASALSDPAKLLLIGCVNGSAIGMARFDLLEPGVWEVSINLDPACRGRGLSRPLLAAALAAIAQRQPTRVVARIKPFNAVSRHLFESLGFRLVQAGEAMNRYALAPGRSG